MDEATKGILNFDTL